MIVEDPLARARRLDRVDELGHLVDAFHPVADGPGYRTIYLAGHSLGLQPRTATRLIDRELRRWRDDGVSGWPQRWLDLTRHAATRLEAVLGAAPGSVHVGDSVAVQLHQAAGAALTARPDRPDVVASEGDPPAVLLALEQRVRTAGGRLRLVPAAPEADRIARELDDRVGLVALGHIDPRTGRLLDLADITETAHRGGSWVLWDCTGSAGAVPLSLQSAGVELAVGGTDQHLCGGPGAPGWIMARPDLVERLDPTLHGSAGQDGAADGSSAWSPASGAQRFAVGSPPVLSLVAAIAGLDLVAAVDPVALRTKTAALTQLAVDVGREWLGPLDVDVLTPRLPERRSAVVTLRHDDAERLAELANQRLGVVCDAPSADVLRLGLSPLPLRHVDVVAALGRLRDALATGAHLGRTS